MTGKKEFVSPPWLAPALLVAAIALAYANSLRAPFLFDDAAAVLNNPTIRSLASLDVLRPPADGSTTTGRPLVNFSFALNHALSGENPWSYHALNLAIHCAAALTLMGLVRRTLLLARGRSLLAGDSKTLSSPSPASRLLPADHATAAFIALLWALHPLQTESVVCVAQRTEVLCGLFFLLTLYAFARASEMGGHVPVPAFRRHLWLVLSVIASLLGMASKEVMVTAPVVVLLYDRTFVAGTFAAAWRARRGYYAALAATWLLLAALVFQSGGARGVAAGFDLGVSPWSYLLKQCEALVLYLRLAVWPHPLVLDYGTAVARSVAEVWWQGLIIVALLAGTVWALVRKPVAGFLGGCFFLILAPSSSFVPLVTQTMAEHRMYLPLAALVVGAAFGLHARWPAATRFALPALALVFGVATHARNRDYRDALTIWSTTVADYPSSARAHHNLALVLHPLSRPAEAHTHFARAVELDPAYVTAWSNWAVALLSDRRLDEAIRCFERALSLAPRGDGSAAKLAQPLADAHVELARLLERERRTAEAETHYATALQLAPDHATAHAQLGLLFARTERLDDAARHLREAVRLSPADASAHANLGNVLLLQGQPREALEHYEAALRLRPDDARLRESLRTAREALRAP